LWQKIKAMDKTWREHWGADEINQIHENSEEARMK
jgi:hypothetical protein